MGSSRFGNLIWQSPFYILPRPNTSQICLFWVSRLIWRATDLNFSAESTQYTNHLDDALNSSRTERGGGEEGRRGGGEEGRRGGGEGRRGGEEEEGRVNIQYNDHSSHVLDHFFKFVPRSIVSMTEVR